MSKQFSIITVLILNWCLLTNAQHGIYNGKYYKGFMPIVKVKDSTLLLIIDSLIDFEKRCEYYKPDLKFSVFLHMDSTVTIESMDDRIYEGEPNKGCFTYHGHLFIVGGKKLNENLFTKTGKKKIITYYKPSNKDLSPEDDSYTMWVYKYMKGKFTLVGRHTFCQ